MCNDSEFFEKLIKILNRLTYWELMQNWVPLSETFFNGLQNPSKISSRFLTVKEIVVFLVPNTSGQKEYLMVILLHLHNSYIFRKNHECLLAMDFTFYTPDLLLYSWCRMRRWIFSVTLTHSPNIKYSPTIDTFSLLSKNILNSFRTCLTILDDPLESLTYWCFTTNHLVS